MATSPLTDQTTRNDYTATASQTTFPYTFWIKDEDHLDVYVNDVLKALTTDYTVTATQSVTGSDIVFNTGIALDDKVAIVYTPDIERSTDYTTGGSLRAAALNTDLTYNLSLTQYLKTELGRTLSLSPSDSSSANLSLPVATASQVLGWNSTATGLTNYSFSDISTSLDAVFTGISLGDYIRHNGTNWVNVDSDQLTTDLGLTKTNISVSNPTVSNDSSQGYAPFSEWINSSTTEKWVCLDSSVGAAVWEQGTLDSSDLGSAALTTLIDDDTFATATSSNIPSAESVKAYVDSSASSLVSGTVDDVSTGSPTSSLFGSIPAGTKLIKVMFSGVSLSGTDYTRIRIGDSGGIETTGYDTTSSYSTAGTVTYNKTDSLYVMNEGFTGATFVIKGTATLTLLDSATNTWTYECVVGDANNSVMYISSGEKSLSGALTQVEITPSGSDTFDAGKINILYM